MTTWRAGFARHADLALVLAVGGILLVLFVPIPKALLDLLVLANFGLAFLLLLLAFHVQRPVDLSTFPSLLLLATLFRLSLNVAATRLILSDGDAGRVIGAIGAHVVSGSYVVGIVVFSILVIVQYVVVTSGAQRVSEVAARFTLDSMPGQQMSIDADLNMGFIDQAEAQRRRRALEKEASFHGAMDGASKFVKGDAVAGIVVLVINILGGLAIGIAQHGMPWSEALRTYALLTIGDGIVTQVPALVIAVATGIIVTRSAGDGNLGREAVRQLTAKPQAQAVVAVALLALVLLPGIPAWPALLLAALSGTVAWACRSARGHDAEVAERLAEPSAGEAAAPAAIQRVEPVELRLGAALGAGLLESGGDLQARLGGIRQALADELGWLLPAVRVRPVAALAPDGYEIHVDGALAGRGLARIDRWLALHAGGDQKSVPGEPVRDPAYGLPGLWIEPTQRDSAVAAGFTLVDPSTVVLTHVGEVLRREAAVLLGRAEADRLLAEVRERHPALVEECVPGLLSVGDVQKVLQALLREKVSIRHLDAILESLADAARSTKDLGLLTEAVRHRLSRLICQQLSGDGSTLHVLTLDPQLEGRLLQSAQASGTSTGLAGLDARTGERLLLQLAQQAERMVRANLAPVLLCAPELRRQLRALSERALPQLRVLSLAEVPQAIELKAFGTVSP